MSTYHKMSLKHRNRHIQEFSGRHNGKWPLYGAAKLKAVFAGMVEERLSYAQLVGGES